jgi:hypothetical protein
MKEMLQEVDITYVFIFISLTTLFVYMNMKGANIGIQKLSSLKSMNEYESRRKAILYRATIVLMMFSLSPFFVDDVPESSDEDVNMALVYKFIFGSIIILILMRFFVSLMKGTVGGEVPTSRTVDPPMSATISSARWSTPLDREPPYRGVRADVTFRGFADARYNEAKRSNDLKMSTFRSSVDYT